MNRFGWTQPWGSFEVSASARYINAENFGVVADGDGLGGGTDNSVALLAMRDQIRGHASLMYNISLPTGIVEYSNNAWLAGVQNFRLTAYGTSLCCTKASGQNADRRPFYSPSFFDWTTLAPKTGNIAYYMGHLIETVSEGASSFIYKAGSVIAPSVGNRILIYGMNRQDTGYPPNPGRWHYATVTGVSGSTVTFDPPSPYLFNENWWDLLYLNAASADLTQPGDQDHPGDAWYGKPRAIILDGITKSDAVYYFGRYNAFEGFTVLPNPTLPATDALVWQSEYVEWKNIQHTSSLGNITATLSKKVLIEGSNFGGTIELDKATDLVTLVSSKFGGLDGQAMAIKAGSGVKNIVIDEVESASRFNALALETITVTNAELSTDELLPSRAPIQWYNNTFSGSASVFTNMTLIKSGAQPDVMLEYQSWVLGTDLSLTTDKNLIYAGPVQPPSYFFNFFPGQPIYNAALTYVIGYVLDLVESGTDYKVLVDWITIPGATDTINTSAIASAILESAELQITTPIAVYGPDIKIPFNFFSNDFWTTVDDYTVETDGIGTLGSARMDSILQIGQTYRVRVRSARTSGTAVIRGSGPGTSNNVTTSELQEMSIIADGVNLVLVSASSPVYVGSIEVVSVNKLL